MLGCGERCREPPVFAAGEDSRELRGECINSNTMPLNLHSAESKLNRLANIQVNVSLMTVCVKGTAGLISSRRSGESYNVPNLASCQLAINWLNTVSNLSSKKSEQQVARSLGAAIMYWVMRSC